MNSNMRVIGRIPFPEMRGERIYMREVFKHEQLPADIARWQPTFDALTADLDFDGPAYLMVDQAFVLAGEPHRRPGVHVDGNWIVAKGRYDEPGHGFRRAITARGGRHYHRTHVHGADYAPEALLLASDVQACRAYLGDFDGVVGEGGDCAHLDLSHLTAVDMEAHMGYIGQVSLLHESLPVPHNTFRTLVRLNIPGLVA